jgi:hypothetical protein
LTALQVIAENEVWWTLYANVPGGADFVRRKDSAAATSVLGIDMDGFRKSF